MNQGIHYLDLLCWMMGPVTEVTALCATQAHEVEVEDVALALLRFQSGAVGLMQAATAVYPGFPERLEISGTGGTVVVEAGAIRSSELTDERGEVGAYGVAASTAAGRARHHGGRIPQRSRTKPTGRSSPISWTRSTTAESRWSPANRPGLTSR